ncbi:hypothetical protein BG015_008856 [Linnemannia schmuckeri]|uniref:HCP-like protein n=1 Tax=Linnemannia schmuckeri TaxID=64567 RepID=A0A9P5S9D7_9FUNG|nr:hypothetical protein BG015_008856 [Linnemannia schmuckeri]
MVLKPLRIAVVPNVVLDVAFDSPLIRLEAVMQQATLTDTPKEGKIQDVRNDDTTVKYTVGGYGSYSHIDHPGFKPTPRAPQFFHTAEQEEDTNVSTPNASKSHSKPTNNSPQLTKDKPASNAQSLPSPQDHSTVGAAKDITPIFGKATLGDKVFQVELGNMYKTGDGVEQDYSAAYYWYFQAANQGDPSAQCSIGDFYCLRLGVDVNFTRAFAWYNKAADQGDADGHCNTGLVYDYGLLGHQNFSAART